MHFLTIIAGGTELQQQSHYDVFISCRQAEPDMTIAARLQAILEGYRTPRALVRKGAPPHIGQVYRHAGEAPGIGQISPDVREALLRSRFLIVVCSPRTPGSAWINAEIEAFRAGGRGDHALALLIEGEPSEAFPRAICEVRRTLTDAAGVEYEEVQEVEPLAADVRAPSLQRSLRLLRTESLRLLAPLLGYAFDDLRQRQRERQVRRAVQIASVAAVLGLTFGSYSLYRWWDAARAALAANQAREGAEKAALQAGAATDRAARGAAEASRQTAVALDQTRAAETERARAERGEQEAKLQTDIAIAKTREADEQRAAALEQRDRALRAQSLFLADLSRRQTESGAGTTGILLALEGLPRPGNPRPLVREALAALYAGIYPAGDRAVLTGHKDDVWLVRYSADGARLLSASIDGSCRVWDTRTGKLLATLPAGTDGQSASASFSQDGRRVATGSLDGAVFIWDADTGMLKARLTDHHPSSASDVALSPDGRFVAAAAGDAAYIWGMETERLLSTMTGHSDKITSVAFSPDSRRLVTTSADRTAMVWDVGTGKAIARLSGHTDRIRAAKFSPDGTRVVTRSDDLTAAVWNATTGKRLHLLAGHTDWVWAADFSPDGARVVTASADGTARFWDADTGQMLVQTRPQALGISGAAFSPDGTILATSGIDHTVRTYDARTGREIARLRGHTEAVLDLAFSPDGQYLATGSFDDSVRIWNVKSPVPVQFLGAHKSMVSVTAFSPDGRVALTAGDDETPRLWSVADGKLLAELKCHTVVAYDAEFSPDGRYILTGSEDGNACLWDARTAQLIRMINAGWNIKEARFSPDGRMIATAILERVSEDRYERPIRLWDTQTGKPLATLVTRPDESIFKIAFSPDGRYLLATTIFGFRVYDLHTYQPHVDWAESKWVQNGQFSPDSRRLVVGTSDNSAYVWDLETRTQVMALKGHLRMVDCVAFSPDGRRIVTGSSEGNLRLWNSDTGQSIAVLAGHGSGMMDSCQFSSDGAFVLSASWDRTARVWDASSGEPLAVLTGHNSDVSTASFSPDGRYILTGDRNGEVGLWRFFPVADELIAYAGEVVSRSLTPEERQEFALEARSGGQP